VEGNSDVAIACCANLKERSDNFKTSTTDLTTGTEPFAQRTAVGEAAVAGSKEQDDNADGSNNDEHRQKTDGKEGAKEKQNGDFDDDETEEDAKKATAAESPATAAVVRRFLTAGELEEPLCGAERDPVFAHKLRSLADGALFALIAQRRVSVVIVPILVTFLPVVRLDL